MNVTARIFQTAWITGLLLLPGCRTPEASSFAQLHAGMSQEEVIKLLGPPSSEWIAPPPKAGEPLPDWSERWHYGDTLSTAASAAMGPDIAPDGVWVVTFDDKGQVINFRTPIQADESYPVERPPK